MLSRSDEIESEFFAIIDGVSCDVVLDVVAVDLARGLMMFPRLKFTLIGYFRIKNLQSKFLRLYCSEVEEKLVNIMDLFAIATKMNVTRLKSICKNLILESLDQTNAQKVFKLAHFYKSEEMKQ